MQEKTIIVVSGEMAAGKGAVRNYIADAYQAHSIRSSDVFRRALDVICAEQTRESVSEMSRVLRIGFGQSVAVESILAGMGDDEYALSVIDGIRRSEEVDALRKGNCRVHVIYVCASVRTRYDRMIERGENAGDAQKSFEEFLESHNLNAESAVDEVKALADVEIGNDGTLEDLYEKIDQVMKHLDFGKVCK